MTHKRYKGERERILERNLTGANQVCAIVRKTSKQGDRQPSPTSSPLPRKKSVGARCMSRIAEAFLAVAIREFAQSVARDDSELADAWALAAFGLVDQYQEPAQP
jgi:hypothetical protein